MLHRRYGSRIYLPILETVFQSGLELFALFLGIVNGLMLLKLNLRDKPKLTVKPIHADIYQWWFRFKSARAYQ